MPFTIPSSEVAECDRQLLLRTLQIPAAIWHRVLADYQQLLLSARNAEPEQRLLALSRAYRAHSPHAAPLPLDPLGLACAVCGATALQALVARAPGPLIWARCSSCQHGILLNSPAQTQDVYRADSYYRVRDRTGAGYDGYGSEAHYREQKGTRLLERVAALTGERLQRLLEVGSGFGYTRVAAERLGILTGGVDLNPYAATESKRRYGLDTFVGNLREALTDSRSGISSGAWDAVLYQFVFEHIADLGQELKAAAQALRPEGWLVLMVPNVQTAELEVFGGSYRSLRADHLHLFSAASLRQLLRQFGFVPLSIQSGCNLHLLHGFLNTEELSSLYASGQGPDLLVVARKRP